jgi:hypothetical protein
MSLASFLRRLFGPRPDPLDPDDIVLLDTMRAEHQLREDRLRRENALDRSMDRAHQDALVEDAAVYRKRMRPTPITRKLRGIVK